MTKLYNIQSDITTGFRDFLKIAVPDIRKTQLNFIPSLLFGLIDSESCASSDIATSLKDELKWAQFDSVVKRINRFWSNPLFDGYHFYNSITRFILNDFIVKHNNKKIHITFDHMFSHDNYAVFMFSMRVGTQGIPIYFQCFKGSDNTDAFKIETLKNGIKAVNDLFADKDVDLIFLADRWFNSTDLLEYIDSLGHTYCVRLKGNIHVYEQGSTSCIKAKKLKHRKYRATVHKDVLITNKCFKTNIVYSNSLDSSTPWIIVTNKDIDHAVLNYSYRFGSIECIFKNQKSNGFNLQKISNMSIHAFTNMYSLVCTCVTYLTILGADFSKNSKCYKNVKITTHKNYNINGKKIKKRVKSLFNTGLTLFKIAFNSYQYIRLPMTFKLYDI